ncbi:MAG: hypothetical protein CMJ26_02240 [Phycisphaerae bacterium]|nr:hypothetical protein [Phycisphaerae bacterium]
MSTTTTKKKNISPKPHAADGNFRKLGSGGGDARASVAKKGEHKNTHSKYFILSISQRIPFIRV